MNDVHELAAVIKALATNEAVTLGIQRNRRTLSVTVSLTTTPPPVPQTPATSPVTPEPKTAYGRHTRPPLIGIWTVSAGAPQAHVLGIESPAGAALTQVQNQSPAAVAGLRTGDLIVAYDNQEIANYEDLECAVLSRELGSTHEVTFVRGMTRRTTQLTIGAGPEGRETYRDYHHATGDINCDCLSRGP